MGIVQIRRYKCLVNGKRDKRERERGGDKSRQTEQMWHSNYMIASLIWYYIINNEQWVSRL